MKLVIQRVKEASVKVKDKVIAEIGKGIVVLIGFEKGDNVKEIDEKMRFVRDKALNLRIFEDENRKMNLSVKDIQGSILIVSNFTLAALVKKGRRPSFDNALHPEMAKVFFERFVAFFKECDLNVQSGEFGAYMQVKIVNDGPLTFIIEK